MIRVERTPAAAVTGAKWTGTAVGFGQELRHERERLGVPLEALADATKVPVRNLRALEDDHWAELPGGVFTKGIVRGYCKVLGLPESQWMERLASSAEQATAEADWAEFAQAVKRNRAKTSPVVRRRWWGVLGMGGRARYAGLGRVALRVARPDAVSLRVARKNQNSGAQACAAEPRTAEPRTIKPRRSGDTSARVRVQDQFGSAG